MVCKIFIFMYLVFMIWLFSYLKEKKKKIKKIIFVLLFNGCFLKMVGYWCKSVVVKIVDFVW